MNDFDPEKRYHYCGDYLNSYCLGGRRVGDEVYCRCMKIYTLLVLTSWRYLAFWRIKDCTDGRYMWWHDKAAEKRAKREAVTR